MAINIAQPEKINAVFIYDFIVFITIVYIHVTVRYYIKYKKAGLLNSPERNKHIKSILIWPLCINPLSRIFERLFVNYGNTNTIHFGLTGFKNFYNDILKGKDRYKDITPMVLMFKLEKPIESYPFENVTHARLLLAKKKGKILYSCELSSKSFDNSSWSIYELDRATDLSSDELAMELKTLHLDDCEIQKTIQNL